MNTPFIFPDFKTVYPQGQHCSWRYGKFFLRQKILARIVRQFTADVNNCPAAQAFFIGQESEAYAVMHSFLDLRFSASERAAAILYTLENAPKILGETRWKRLLTGEKIPVAHFLDGALTLFVARNDNCGREGFFTLGLHDAQQKMIDSTTWAFLPNNKILLASVQGRQDCLAEMKFFTQKLDHLRPRALLITAAKLFAATLGQQLFGIPQNYQVKYRFALKKRIQTDYNQLWRENGGQLQQDYWFLPPWEEKSLQSVPTRKRAQYRRRNALFVALAEELKNLTGV